LPEHTRRRYPDAREECWHVYYGEVHAGTLSKRTGNPHDTDPWEWRCGFYPGSHPGECRTGTAASLEEARAGFEEAWKVFLSNRTEADFQAWRDQRDWTARKYALWDAGKRLEPPSHGPGKPCSKFMRCAYALYLIRLLEQPFAKEHASFDDVSLFLLYEFEDALRKPI
jgi:hypothetical protein